MTSSDSSALYELSDELSGRLAYGQGLNQRDGLTILSPGPEDRSWALVTYNQREDAERVHDLGLQLAAPPDELHSDKMVQCVVRRTVDADTARQMLDEVAESKRRQHELCATAVAKIQSWVKHHGKQLSDLFARIDTDGSGDFDVSEFRAGMLSIGLTFCDETMQAMMAFMDADGGGSIETHEFVQKIDRFAEEEFSSAGAILVELSRYMDTTGESVTDICRRSDLDGSGVLSVREFRGALSKIGIKLSLQAAQNIMAELDMDRNKELELTVPELTARMGTYRRKRRAFVAQVLDNVLVYIQRTKASAVRIFSRVDTDGTGDLDSFELQEALLRMGQELTLVQVSEVMAELDCDSSSSVSVSEFLDKLKHAENVRAADMKKCKELFECADSDGSGCLDADEVRLVAEQMGLGDQLTDPEFVNSMILELQKVSTAAQTAVEIAADCQVTFEAFFKWFSAIGKSYLEQPKINLQPDLTVPSDEELAELFVRIDVDGSGSVDLAEVQDALRTVWPFLDPSAFQRAFSAADQDGSGCVDEVEFKHLFSFLVFLNEWRHTIQELDDGFGTHVGEDEFYFGCQCLQINLNGDGAAKFLFEEECRRKGEVEELTANEYIQWAVRYICVTMKEGPPPETEAQRKARICTEMSKELEHAAGEYGDVHLVDLATILGKNRGQISGPETTASRVKARKAASTALECSQLIRRGIEYSINENDGFPTLSEPSLRMMVRMCKKEEFFSGENIVTQGESDTNYYVLRRGRVQMSVDEVPVRTLEWGMAFGEIGLLLNTKQTATISALTPCEVYVLDRAGYETVLSLLPEGERLGPLTKALNKFWVLMTGPDGSQRQSVDYKTYLKAHIRTSKTLTGNSGMDDFDEDEEREVAQSDWAEDCERCGMKVTETLSKEQYFDAMYQLVDLWSEDCKLSFATFLDWVFENIAQWDEGSGCWVFRDLIAVECVGDKFEELKEEARAEEALKVHREEQAKAAAEEARKAHLEQVQIERERAAREAEEQKLKQEEEERHLRETDKLGAERLDINRQLEALAVEEAELQRRLASGELSLEDQAKVRARLAAIAAERDQLKLQLKENECASRLAGYDKALAALDSEEAELRRRLAAGDLTPEEEAGIRQRLDDITAERECLLKTKHEVLLAQQEHRAERLDKQRAAQVAALNTKLQDIENEEADLLRRLASGELTPEEEAKVRARLAVIAEERAILEGQRNDLVAVRHAAQLQLEKDKLAAQNREIGRQLSALDDEEAELQLRLASGELSPEEEAAVRARLAAIAQERAMLKYQQSQNNYAAQHADINAQLVALDDEEAELRRKLGAGGLSPGEEAAIRQRLKDIEDLGNKLRLKQMDVYREEEEAMQELAASDVLSEHERKRIQNRIYALVGMQQRGGEGEGGFSAQEEELMRKLASGKLTPEEAEAARARLAVLVAERQAAEEKNKRKHARVEERQQLAEKLKDIDAQLSALEDEEAKLRRTLATGAMSAEEEAAIRKRLDEIEQAKAMLTAERHAILELRDAMDASEHAAVEEERQYQLARERKLERARRKNKERRRKNFFATINLDPKQGFHENRDDPAQAMRFHGVGRPKVKSVQQASQRLKPLRHSLGQTPQPAALVERLSATSTHNYFGDFRSTLGGTVTFGDTATDSRFSPIAGLRDQADFDMTSMASASAPVPLYSTDDDAAAATVTPVLVRSRTLEAKDKATQAGPTVTRALVEALDEVAIVRFPVIPTSNLSSTGGSQLAGGGTHSSSIEQTRTGGADAKDGSGSGSSAAVLPNMPQSVTTFSRSGMYMTSGSGSEAAKQEGRRFRQRRQVAGKASGASRLARGESARGQAHRHGRSSAPPAHKLRVGRKGTSPAAVEPVGAVSRSLSIGSSVRSSRSILRPTSGHCNGVDLGRHGLPVSLARAVAMQTATAEGQYLSTARSPHRQEHLGPNEHPRELRRRLGTVRGKRVE